MENTQELASYGEWSEVKSIDFCDVDDCLEPTVSAVYVPEGSYSNNIHQFCYAHIREYIKQVKVNAKNLTSIPAGKKKR